MSDRFVPIQAKVWENLGLSTPSEDQPSPFFDGGVGHLVYDLSDYEERDGVLVRQSQPVTVQGQSPGTLDTASVGVNNVAPGSGSKSTLLGVNTNDERDVQTTVVLVEPEAITNGTYEGYVDVLLVDTSGTAPTNEYRVFSTFFEFPDDQLLFYANQGNEWFVQNDYRVDVELFNDGSSPNDLRTTVEVSYAIV